MSTRLNTKQALDLGIITEKTLEFIKDNVRFDGSVITCTESLQDMHAFKHASSICRTSPIEDSEIEDWNKVFSILDNINLDEAKKKMSVVYSSDPPAYLEDEDRWNWTPPSNYDRYWD